MTFRPNSLPNSGIVLVGVWLAASTAQAGCQSGPDWCTDDPRIPNALKEKKDRLAQDYPGNLVALLDRGVQCIARIEQSPDGFSIIDIEPNKNSLSQSWTEDAETVSRQRLAKGEITHYWLVHARRAFACDGQDKFDQRPDYIKDEDINADLAIKCDRNGC